MNEQTNEYVHKQ